MYEKKLGDVMAKPNVLGSLKERKRQRTAVPFITPAIKYLAYFLGVVLSLLLVLLILRTVILAPVSGHEAGASIAAAIPSVMPEEASSNATPAIFPKTAVYYHGEKLGEYTGEEMTVYEVMSQFNIVLGQNDVTNYGLDEKVFQDRKSVV